MTDFTTIVYSGRSRTVPIAEVLQDARAGSGPVLDYGTGFRTRTPRETLNIATPHLRSMGVVRLADITHLDRIGVPVIAAVRPNAAGPTVLHGKGTSYEAACASAVMEAVERFHAERPTVPVVLTSLSQISRGRTILDPVEMPRIAGRGFTSETDIAWVEGVDLRSGQSRWLPFEMVTVHYLRPRPYWHGFFRSETTGIASGNTMLEAILHALHEVIERDCRTLFSVLPTPDQDARRLNLASVADQGVQELVARIDEAGLTVAVWDVANDIEVPCYLTRILERDLSRSPHLMWSTGGGAHTVAEVALRRSITEAVQGRAVLMAGGRDDIVEDHYAPRSAAHQSNWQKWLAQVPHRPFQPLPCPARPGSADELEIVLGRLANADLHQAILVDLTQPEFGIPVASICVPGAEDAEDLEHYSPGPRLVRQLAAHRG